jgi:hypothetical protein
MATPPTVIYVDQIMQGTVTFGSAPSFPAGAITGASIASNAAIDYTKVVGERCTEYEAFADGVSIISVPSRTVHVTRGTSGTQIGLDAFHIVAPTSANCTTTIDLQKTVAASSSWATVLSTPITLTTTSVVYTRYGATFASTGTPMTVGDCFRLVITQAGTTAGAGKGLHISYSYSEAPA